MHIRLIVNTLCEIVPIASFVVIAEIQGFLHAVVVLVVLTIISIGVSWYTEKHIPKFGIVAALFIVGFGALTLVFRNPFFIIIKDTVYYGSFALALLVGLYLRKSVFRFFFDDFFMMSVKGWRILETRWAIFFIILTIANEIARHNLHPQLWAEYKLGVVFVTWVFGFYQLTLSKKERLPEASPLGLRIK